MNYKEKIKWLGQYRAAKSYQHMLEEELQELRSEAERMTACISGMPGRGAPNADRLPRAVERIEEAQKNLAKQMDGCLAKRADIVRSILALDDTAKQEVLRRRYVMGQDYAEIAKAMGVVERRIYQLHKAAVEELTPPAA